MAPPFTHMNPRMGNYTALTILFFRFLLGLLEKRRLEGKREVWMFGPRARRFRSNRKRHREIFKRQFGFDDGWSENGHKSRVYSGQARIAV